MAKRVCCLGNYDVTYKEKQNNIINHIKRSDKELNKKKITDDKTYLGVGTLDKECGKILISTL